MLFTLRQRSLRNIKNKKDIPGKMRQNGSQFACVSNRASCSGGETPETQAIEVELSATFAMRMHAGDEPTLSSPQIQSP